MTHPTDEYTPEAGHRIRRAGWQKGDWLDVIAVHGRDVFGVAHPNSNGRAGTYSTYDSDKWVRVPEPVVYPERWMNVYFYGLVTHLSQGAANRHKGDGRLGLLHLLPDGTTEMLAP